ncbi:MAG: hypothetical protein ACYC1U_00905 [Candidatus Aquicultorales bacterium]
MTDRKTSSAAKKDKPSDERKHVHATPMPTEEQFREFMAWWMEKNAPPDKKTPKAASAKSARTKSTKTATGKAKPVKAAASSKTPAKKTAAAPKSKPKKTATASKASAKKSAAPAPAVSRPQVAPQQSKSPNPNNMILLIALAIIGFLAYVAFSSPVQSGATASVEPPGSPPAASSAAPPSGQSDTVPTGSDSELGESFPRSRQRHAEYAGVLVSIERFTTGRGRRVR